MRWLFLRLFKRLSCFWILIIKCLTDKVPVAFGNRLVARLFFLLLFVLHFFMFKHQFVHSVDFQPGRFDNVIRLLCFAYFTSNFSPSSRYIHFCTYLPFAYTRDIMNTADGEKQTFFAVLIEKRRLRARENKQNPNNYSN